jgi:arylformamidase
MRKRDIPGFLWCGIISLWKIERNKLMKIYDITIPVHPDMPVWPGDSGVRIERVRKIEEGDNANVSHLSLGAHTGTHVDAPYHFVSEGNTLDQVSIERFIGEALVVEILGVNRITAADLEAIDLPPDTKMVLLKTRNSQIWAQGKLKFQEDFVALNPDAAQNLVDRGVSFVGIDYLSIAPFKESSPTHKVLLGAGVVILEGVDLSEVPAGRYTLYCLPLKLDKADGAPARAILVSD